MNLTNKTIFDYWNKRTAKYKERAVGYKPYQKNEFLRQYVNPSYSTLDYGCGIGDLIKYLKDNSVHKFSMAKNPV